RGGLPGGGRGAGRIGRRGGAAAGGQGQAQQQARQYQAETRGGRAHGNDSLSGGREPGPAPEDYCPGINASSSRPSTMRYSAKPVKRWALMYPISQRTTAKPVTVAAA